MISVPTDMKKTGSSLPELPMKRRFAEVSVQPLAALVSSAGTNSNLKIDPGLLCECRLHLHADRARGLSAKMLFDIFFNP